MKNQSAESSVYDITIRLLIVLLIIAWCLMIIYPFTSIILWSLILALAIYPLHNKPYKKNRRQIQTGCSDYCAWHSRHFHCPHGA